MDNRLVVHEGEGYVRVSLQCPGQIAPEAAGRAETFESPWAPQDAEDLRWYLETYLSSPFAVYEDRGAAIQRQIPVWGEGLFAALFGPGRHGRDPYIRARTTGSWELWIASSSTAFLSLPWELLKDPEDSSPLALSPVGIHRTIPTTPPPPALYAGDRLRVLMIVARPKGVDDVGYRTVAKPLLKRLDLVSGTVDFEVLRPPTFDAFRARLRSASREGAPFHVVHFDVHGWFWLQAPPAGVAAMQGAVQFETEGGDGEIVPVERLAPFLAEVEVPLIVLNSCRSAMLPDGTRVDAALATRLLGEGRASSVVAMSHTIYAVSAAEFTSAFYEALFERWTVAEAVTRARLQLRRNPLRPSAMGDLPLEDWMVPVHYARRDLSFPDLVRQPADGQPHLEERLAARLTRVQPAPAPGSEGSIEQEGSVFFSRDREILRMDRALRQRRVLVLHGPAGIGTTELAKAFARWLQISGGLDRPDGAFVHSFAPGIASFALDGAVTAAGARLFGKDFTRLRKGERRERMLAALREERLLLIWDNFESAFSLHDPEGGTQRLGETEREEIVSFLLEVARDARGGVILTSRNPEEWLGESAHRIDIGALDAAGVYEYAEHLLRSLETARGRRKHPAYAELLEILGGNPLALRLILPRLERETPEDLILALRGEQPLRPGGDGFDALESCIRSSFRHLGTEHTERLFPLALFEGAVDVRVLAELSRTTEAPARFRSRARAAWRETLNEGVYVGLLTVLSPDLYRILPTLPAFLADLWRRRAGSGYEAERSAARIAKVKAQARFAFQLLRKNVGREAGAVMDWLDLAHRSLGNAAADALRLGRFREVQKIVQLLNLYWSHRERRNEAAAWLARCRAEAEGGRGRAPALSTPRGALWLFAVFARASQLLRERRLQEAEEELQRMMDALKRASDQESRRRLSGAFFQLGRVALEQKALDEAERWFRKALELKNSVRDQRGIASIHLHLGMIARERGELEKAEKLFDKALRLYENLRSPGLIQVHFELGALAQAQKNLDAAEAAFARSRKIAQELSNLVWQAHCALRLGILDQLQGHCERAETRLKEALQIYERRRHCSGRAETYLAFGRLAAQCGGPREAMDWTVHSAALFSEIESPKAQEAIQDLAGPAAQLGIDALEESWQRCTGAPLPDSIREAVQDRAD